jgi:ribosomal protein S13
MTKQEIAEVFEEIGALLELKSENPFRVRAYYNAARMIDGLQEDLGTLIKEDRLTDIKGIGKDLAAKITELYTTGRLKAYDELKASMPAGLLEMLKIPGFGPKRAKVVYDKLKIDTLEKRLPSRQDRRARRLRRKIATENPRRHPARAAIRQPASVRPGTRCRAADHRLAACARRRDPLQHCRQPAPVPGNHRRH